MAATENEMAGLLGEHEVIRAHVKFLTNSLNSLATQSSQIKDRVSIYRYGLYDLRDGVRRHIELDERIFEAFLGITSMEETIREHDEIRKQVDEAIRLADHATESNLGQEDLNQCALNIIKVFNQTRELIEAHMAKEDRLLKRAQKDR
jgi:hemerythrin-like domain-containing protein